MSDDLAGWIAAQRAVCAVQKQRWEGVAPERLEEACTRLEALSAHVQMVAQLLAEIQEVRAREQLGAGAAQVPAGIGGGPGVVSYRPVIPQYAPRPSFVVPIRLDRWQLGVWAHSGLPVQLGGEIPTPSPAMMTAYEAALKKLQGSVVELPVW